jgi:hypothetical protein
MSRTQADVAPFPSPREAVGRVGLQSPGDVNRGGGLAAFIASPPPTPPRHAQELVGRGETRVCK